MTDRVTLIVLGSDGRHVLLGRCAEPDAAELARIGEGLTAAGLGGWIARMRGDFWHRRRAVRLEEVRVAAPCSVTFAAAVAAFQALRQSAAPP